MVLCYSRLCYLEFSLGEATEHFLAAHQNALEFFGRVPAKIIIDNPKTSVLKHPAGERPLFHPLYLDFAAHYGFEPRDCSHLDNTESIAVEVVLSSTHVSVIEFTLCERAGLQRENL
jgi:transposase